MSQTSNTGDAAPGTAKPQPVDIENPLFFAERGSNEGQLRAYKSKNGLMTKNYYVGPSKSIKFFFADVFKQTFLPCGYPDSVSSDYAYYQLWDTVQAFCSTITGTFTTQSILKSVGVGDETATALGAAITWIIKDGSGMGGRIIFAWWKGNSLDSDCKSWRLFADILNDIALAIEFILPYLKLNTTLYVLCTTSMMKSIVGVAGGATRAAITQHQAIRNNMADVSAKDGSQETCVNLLASIVGIFLLTYCHNQEGWLLAIFTLLTMVHIVANYKAVRALVFHDLNLSRLLIVLKSYLQHDAVANPANVNKTEPVVYLFKPDLKKACGFRIKMGSSMNRAIVGMHVDKFQPIYNSFIGYNYILLPCFKNRTIYASFVPRADSEVVIQAYFHAFLFGLALSHYNNINLNIKVKRQLHHMTPIQRLSNLMKRMPRNPNQRGLDMFPREKLVEFNDFVLGETQSFFTALGINDWDLTRNFLPVGEWRCNQLDQAQPITSQKKVE